MPGLPLWEVNVSELQLVGLMVLSAMLVLNGCGAASGADAHAADAVRPSTSRGVGAGTATAERAFGSTAADRDESGASAPVTVTAPGTVAAAGRNPMPGAPASSCAPPNQSAIWAAIPASEREGLDDAPRRLLTVELDGTAPEELAVAVNTIHPYGEGESSSHLWILRCSGGAWVSAGNLAWGINEMWEGFYDGPAGVVVMRAEAVAGVPHAFLRVERVDMRGGVDPRYYERHFTLIHVVDGVLVTAFSCETHSESVSGAERETEFDTRRVVTYRPGQQPAIRVQVSTARDDGAPRRIASAEYQFNGRMFVADRDVCGL